MIKKIKDIWKAKQKRKGHLFLLEANCAGASCLVRGSGQISAQLFLLPSFLHNHKQAELISHSEILLLICSNSCALASVLREHPHSLYLFLGSVGSLMMLVLLWTWYGFPLSIITVATCRLLIVSQAPVPLAPYIMPTLWGEKMGKEGRQLA